MAEETNPLRVRLVTPERILYEHEALAVDLPASTGLMEVLYGHAPLMTELGAGDVIVYGGPKSDSARATGGTESATRYNVSWGFAEVLGDRVTILASDALRPEEIDVPRAQQQLARGHQLWNEAGDSAEAYDEALHVIDEAEAKLASAAEKH